MREDANINVNNINILAFLTDKQLKVYLNRETASTAVESGGLTLKRLKVCKDADWYEEIALVNM